MNVNLEFPAVFFCPTFNHDFLIRIEFDRIATLAMEIAEETVLPSTERKICHWGRHADIDSDVSSRRLVAEAARRRSARSKQRGLITVGTAFQESERVVQVLSVNKTQDGPEDLRIS